MLRLTTTSGITQKYNSQSSEEDLSRHIDSQRRSQATYSAVYSVEPQKILVSSKDIVKVENGKEDVYVKFI
ncbi:MAG: hypothetical protein WCF23_04780 [Candidatus Nitrosopolaris sp.]